MKLGEQKTRPDAVLVLASNIRAMRLKTNTSQIVLAEQAGLAPSVIADIERGVTWNPGLFTIINIARALDTTLSVLLEGDPR